jgi:uncharacterized protein YkwD
VRLSLLLVIFLALVPGQARALDPLCADANEVKFLTVINEYRAAHGVAPLVLSRSLSWAADTHADYMADTDDVDHFMGDLSWADNIWVTGYPGPWIGENVLAGRQSAGGALALFASSPSHNRNMLNPLWKSIGIGREVNLDGKYRYYWATEFGSVRHRTVTC